MAANLSPENRALHSCARLLFSGTDKPSRLLRNLCEHLVDIPGNKLPLAAAAALVDGLPSSALALAPLICGHCFLSIQDSSEVHLDVKSMMEQAKRATSPGILHDELPPPAGYVYGKHPLRPGQRNCSYYMQKGVCMFEQRCVFNHPANNHNDILPYFVSSSDAVTNASSNDGSATTSNSSRKPPAGATAAAGTASSPEGVAAAASAVAQYAWGRQQQQQHAPSRPAAVAGPMRPDKPRCIMLLTRGVCTAGPSCPYDHTPESRSASPSPANISIWPGTPSAAEQSSIMQTPDLHKQQAAATSPVAAAVEAAATTSIAAAAAGSAAGAGLFSPRTAEQEQLLQATMKRFVQQRDRSSSLNGFVYPVTGTTAEGYPQRPGAANCTFYMYSGECKFKANCVYHHPDNVAHPIRFITTGRPSQRWAANDPVPFSRLVTHLDRLWDYSSCCECQLKKWLAYQLICAANPTCSMWDRSAAQCVVAGADEWSAGDRAAAAGQKPLGPYSCSLSEAGILLHKLWSEQPDAAAAALPMPYHKRVRELLATDPYYEVAPDPSNASHLHVRLNVGKIREMLNW